MVLSEDTSTDSAMIFRLARRFLYVSKFEATRVEKKDPYLDYHSGASDVGYKNDHLYGSHDLNGAKSGPPSFVFVLFRFSFPSFALASLSI